MLNFIVLFRLLVVCAVLFAFFRLIRKLKQRVDIKVKSGSGNVLKDLAFLKTNKEEGTGFDVRLTADNKRSIGSVVVKDEKCWVYLPKNTKDDSYEDNNLRKIGYVDSEGFIYLHKKGYEPKLMGYMAKPSSPSVPSLKGERSWRDLWWKSRLNVYFGDPKAWSNSASDAAPIASVTPMRWSEFRVSDTSVSESSNTQSINLGIPTIPPTADFVETVGEPEIEPEFVLEPEPVPEPVQEPVDSLEPVTPEQEVNPVTESVQQGPVPSGYELTEQEAAYLQTVKERHTDIISQILQEMIRVDGGTFLMGVSDTDSKVSDHLTENNEGPAHKVSVDSFCIGMYPVSQKEWSAIMGYNNSAQINDDFPVAPVDWNEAILFINRLNALTGLKFSLPTEAQWEFAARGGNLSNGYIYAGSNIKSQVCWDNQYSPVGKKRPNELGLYDMSGLVREWCLDWYVNRYPSEEQYNPMGPAMPELPEERKRVVRSPFGNETVTNRKGELQDNPRRFTSYGFRLACEPSKELGKRTRPVLVGQSVKSGFLGGSPKHCPVTDEGRGGAYALFYSQYGKNAYSEYLGNSPYGWADTALLSSLVFSILFLVLYFINTALLELPLLGNDLKAIIALSSFYFLLWALIRAIKIESVENGSSIQPYLDLMNKSVGYKNMDLVFIILGYLCMVWTFFYYDADFIPLIFAISIGLTLNRTSRRAAEPWTVIDPLRNEASGLGFDIDDDSSNNRIKAPEGDTRKEYSWKLDSFEGKEVNAHLMMWFNQADIRKQRLKNPFFLEKPNLAVEDYKNSFYKMIRELETDDSKLYHLRYALQEIKRISSKNDLSEIDSLQFIMDFVQESIVYKMDNECRELANPKEYTRYPDELLYDQQGDCDCKAFLAMTFFHELGYDIIYLISREIGHAALAVAVKDSIAEQYLKKETLDDITIDIDGTRYYFCETTSDGFRFGDIQQGFSVDQFETRIEWKHNEDEEEE